MPYILRDRTGHDGSEPPTAESPGLGPDSKSAMLGQSPGPCGEGVVQIEAVQVEQSLDMLGKLAGRYHV